MKPFGALFISGLIALATALPARAISYDALLNTPKADPCHLFTADVDMVVLYLDMGVEGEVQLSLPSPYLEHRADQQSGLRHGSLLLRMMVSNFLPVSSAQALRLSATQQGNDAQTAFITMLISDLPDISERLETLSMTATPNDVGLVPLVGTTPAPRTSFAALHPDQSPHAFIECMTPETTPRPTCTHQLRTSGVDVVLDYNADLLPIWADVQTRVERFLGCAAAE
ncbi:hypothetical protein J3R80_02910 [Aliiroseovarius sp. Z3]|uniref:hypothetical protein n=1 Tax=Aliiroseovarius sp. Z3 TaxID=2811402 RepID=UPI0023B2B574|nr:hypothetical protein [Aliiroseovarius sp. Z3]MDE9449416.1 hypothetical protein [Aliiroseovarius sp. Z3]